MLCHRFHLLSACARPLNYTDEFIAYKNKLLIKAYKKINILYSYIKELIIVLIQVKLATRPPLRLYYITIDP